jgi:hypothetical protein
MDASACSSSIARRVNVGIGAQSDGPGAVPAISAEGFVAFESDAANLVPDDPNAATDIIVPGRCDDRASIPLGSTRRDRVIRQSARR